MDILLDNCWDGSSFLWGFFCGRYYVYNCGVVNESGDYVNEDGEFVEGLVMLMARKLMVVRVLIMKKVQWALH